MPNLLQDMLDRAEKLRQEGPQGPNWESVRKQAVGALSNMLRDAMKVHLYRGWTKKDSGRKYHWGLDASGSFSSEIAQGMRKGTGPSDVPVVFVMDGQDTPGGRQWVSAHFRMADGSKVPVRFSKEDGGQTKRVLEIAHRLLKSGRVASAVQRNLIALGDAHPELREHIRPVLSRLKGAAIRDMRDANDVLSLAARKVEDRIRAMRNNGDSEDYIDTVERAWDKWDTKTLAKLRVLDPRLKRETDEAIDFIDRNASTKTAAAPEHMVLDKAISQWVQKTKSKLNRGDVRVDVRLETRGIRESRNHPHWSIGIVYWYDEVEPSVRNLEVEGDALHVDVVTVSRHDMDLPNNRSYNDRSKELYDWKVRDVLAMLDRFL